MRARVRGLSGGLLLLLALLPSAPGSVSVAAERAAAIGNISAGHSHVCAIASPFAVRCWGMNDHGQLGNGRTSGLDPNPRPGDVSGRPNGIEAVAGGLYHSCDIDVDTVRCWGWNAFGQLGAGDTNDRLTPTAVTGLPGAPTMVVAGSGHTCAVVGGGVHCWGHNDEGQLGNGQAGCDPQDLFGCQSATPVAVPGLSGVTDIKAGSNHTCAVAGGRVSCWGANWSGQLGNGRPPATEQYAIRPVAVTGLTDARKVALGTDHSCALTGSGGVMCWGGNDSGQLGDGTKTDRSTPVTVATRGAAQLAAAWVHTCLVSTKGGVACWGRNQWGQLGDGTKTNRTRPVAVSGLGVGSDVLEVTGGYQFTCALLADNDVRCWGRNDFGQLGDGTTETRTKPAITLFDCLGRPPTITAQPGELTNGTPGDDVIVGTNGADRIDGGGGEDRICGYGGNDQIVSGDGPLSADGGAGNDEIAGGDAEDRLVGADGNDNITSGKGNDYISGDAGEDKLRGDEDNDAMFGGPGVDLLLGSDGNDDLFGGDGDDLLNGGAGADNLQGQDDNDVIVGGVGNDLGYGEDGEDVISGGGGTDDLQGGAQDDHVSGGPAGDRVSGDAGNDLLFGGTGEDVISGGAGDDRLTGNEDRDILKGGPGIDHDDGGNDNDTCYGETFEGCFEEHKPG